MKMVKSCRADDYFPLEKVVNRFNMFSNAYQLIEVQKSNTCNVHNYRKDICRLINMLQAQGLRDGTVVMALELVYNIDSNVRASVASAAMC